DTLQTSISIADQEAIERTLPLARERQMGVIAKRPIANVVWRHAEKPDNAYVLPYWERIQRLAFAFLKGDPATGVAAALRFTLGGPGAPTAIVGTAKPGRWRDNAAILQAGPLPAEEFDAIRARWREAAEPSWTGQI